MELLTHEQKVYWYVKKQEHPVSIVQIANGTGLKETEVLPHTNKLCQSGYLFIVVASLEENPTGSCFYMATKKEYICE